MSAATVAKPAAVALKKAAFLAKGVFIVSKVLDLIIIGAGSAGLAALRQVQKHTDNYVIINQIPYGTTCARVGCMPSKALIEAAHAFHARHRHDEFGIRGSEAITVDTAAVLQRVRKLRDYFVSGTLKVTDSLGDRSITGHARLLGPNRVEVDGRKFEARRIIIATGSAPILPKAWAEAGTSVVTTDSVFELPVLPPRMAVVGLGAIGIEFAQALAFLGVEVSAFSQDHQLAGLSDPVVSKSLRESLQQAGIRLHTGEAVELAAGQQEGTVTVRTEQHKVTVDGVLVAIGRQPNTEGLGLETLGVPLDNKGLPSVNPTTAQIADLPVFMAGDVNNYAPLLHEAADEGYIAASNALADKSECFQRRITLRIVFAEPPVAVVGSSYKDLDPDEIYVGEVDFSRQGRARVAQRNEGVMRLYARRSDGRLVGGEMCAPAGDHMAHLLALAIGQRMTAQQLLALPFYHPVLEEGLRKALRRLSRQSGISAPDLTACEDLSAEALD